MELVVKDPQVLVEGGYMAPDIATLETLPELAPWQQELEHWIAMLPGLRTPRERDGSGGTPPRPHQKRHAVIAAHRPENFLAWSMGTGKTSQTVLVILLRFGRRLFAGLRGRKPGTLDAWLAARGPEATGKFLLDTCELPPGAIHIMGLGISLDSVWMKELTRMNLGWAAEVITRESQLHTSKAPIWLYDICNFPKKQSRKGKQMRAEGRGLRLKVSPTGGVSTYFAGHPLAKVIAKRYPPSLLVADEVHRIQKGTERTRCFVLIRDKSKHVLSLTGTPMDGWVRQAATLLATTYREESVAFPFTADDFAKRFTKTEIVATDMATGGEAAEKKERTVPGVNHGQIPVFLKATRHCMHRLNLTDPEVAGHVVYPPVNRHLVEVEPDFEHRLFYDDVHTAGVNAIREALSSGSTDFRSRANALTLLNNLRMASVAPQSLGYEGASTALWELVVQLVLKHAAEGRKCLIGTTFVDEGRLLYERLQAALHAKGVYGVRLYATDPLAPARTMNVGKREELVERFMDEPDCKFLLSSKELVAESLNLSETASVLVSCSWGWRSNIEEQWKARVIRPGQVWPYVDLYELINVRTVDVYVYRALMAKAAATAGIIDQDFSAGGLGNAIDPLELAKLLAA